MVFFDEDKNNYTYEQLKEENARLRAQLKHIRSQNESILKNHLPFMRSLHLIAYSTDLHWSPYYYQGAIKEISGYEEQSFLKQEIKWEQLVHPEDLASFNNQRRNFLEQELDTLTLEYHVISGEGQICWVSDMLALFRNQAGQAELIQGFIIDITRIKLAEEEILERQAHLDSILNSVQDVIWSVTPDTFDLLYINPAAKKFCMSAGEFNESAPCQNSIGQKELLLQNFDTLLSRGSFEAEYCLTLPDGEKRWLQRRAHFAQDAHGLVARIDGIDTDITQRKRAEDALRYISLHDGLTDLYNRFYFESELQQIDREESKTTGLIVCDVDGLKLINDNLGHEAGDRLLLKCAGLLKESFPHDNEIISRIGGDEFTVLIKDCTPEILACSVAQLRQAIVGYNSSNPDFPISMSIGQSLKHSSEISMSEVFKKADDMMYTEKFSNR